MTPANLTVRGILVEQFHSGAWHVACKHCTRRWVFSPSRPPGPDVRELLHVHIAEHAAERTAAREVRS